MSETTTKPEEPIPAAEHEQDGEMAGTEEVSYGYLCGV